jgi:hypothetical protein
MAATVTLGFQRLGMAAIIASPGDGRLPVFTNL